MPEQRFQWILNRVPSPGQDINDFVPVKVILNKKVTKFGRAVANDVQCRSVLCSRYHCSFILQDNGSLSILDHSSLNHTYINKNAVIPERGTQLEDGDLIGLGVDPSNLSSDEHPLDAFFVFKATKEELHKDEPGEPSGGDSNAGTVAVINEPSTSSCEILPSEGKPIQTESSKVVETPGKLPLNKESEEVMIISDDEVELVEITKIESRVKPIESENNFVDSITDTNPVAKPEGKNIETTENSSSKLSNENDGTSVVNHNLENNQTRETAIESCISTLPPNVSLPSRNSVRSDNNEESPEKIKDCAQESRLRESPNLNEEENLGKENIEASGPIEIKEEKIDLLKHFYDGEIVVIDDDEGELPCSQLFDLYESANEHETNDDEENVTDAQGEDDWDVTEEIENNESEDSDSDAEQWFQRLSQSHKFESDEEEQEEEQEEEEEEERDKRAQHVDDEPSNEGGNEKINDTDCSRNTIINNQQHEPELSSEEPILRKIPSGSKRKLSESSDEEVDKMNKPVCEVESLERNVKQICYEEDISISSKTKIKSKKISSQKMMEDSDSNSSRDSVSSLKRKHMERKLSNSDLIPAYKKSDFEEHARCKSKQRRKHSTDSAKSGNSGQENHKINKIKKHHSTTGSNDTSEDSEFEWKSLGQEITSSFISLYGNKSKKLLLEDQSNASCTRLGTNDIEEVGDDIEQIIKPAKIEKGPLKLKITSKIEAHSITQTETYPGEINNLGDKIVANLNENRESVKAKDGKLNEISKKINSTYKKKSATLIDAKPMRVGRKSISIETETVTKKDVQTGEQWLTSKKDLKTPQQPLKTSDLKAYRKEKLKSIAKKESIVNKQLEKPKPFTAKNKTKTTNKSRNDIFLQDLVAKDNLVVENNDKTNKDTTLSSFKIPRRSSHTEENVKTTALIKSSSKTNESKLGIKTIEETPNTSVVQSSAKAVSSKLKDRETKPPTSETSSLSVVDQILKSTAGKVSNVTKKNKSQTKTTVVGVENEEPSKTICLSKEEYDKIFKKSNSHQATKQKSIIKSPLSLSSKPAKNDKKVKFNFPNDDIAAVYTAVCEFAVAEGNKMKPVTKTVSKEKEFVFRGGKSLRLTENPKYTNFWEETLYFILKWNCSWFEEKDKMKKDPPIFGGQLYDLNREFSNFAEYRREMFPLLLYELWGSVSRQYDLVGKFSKKSPLFHIEIRADWPIVVQDNFFALNNTRMHLQHLQCQVVLDKKQQHEWPRMGDLVVLSLIFKESIRIENGQRRRHPAGEKRVIGYIHECPAPKNITAQLDISPRLRELTPNGKLVMDGMKIIIRGDRPQQIDYSELAKFKVLKYIRPEKRVLEALDRLGTSPLCEKICHPVLNSLPPNPTDYKSTPHPLFERLNQKQMNAVLAISNACLQNKSSIHFVHGPPGCGKSEVIIGLIVQMLSDWQQAHQSLDHFPQLLLCAPSNAAIDDLVTKLAYCRNAIDGVPQFEMIRVGVVQSTHESCSYLTLDNLAKKELKRLEEVKEDVNQKKEELQHLEAKKHKYSQNLESLSNRKRAIDKNPAGRKESDQDLIRKIKEVEHKLAVTKSRIKYLESNDPRKPTEREIQSKLKEIQLDLLQKANVVATTLSSCYNGIMSEAYSKRFIKFDCCIVDEATQCIEPDTLIPLMLGVDKMVLVGDPMQLPATVITPTAKQYGLEKSLFARHYDWWKKEEVENKMTGNPFHFLNMQYRMHPEIAYWPSKHFYNNLLLSEGILRDRSAHCPLEPYVVLSHKHLQNVHDPECNTEEARLVTSLFHSMTTHPQCQGLTVGIITPYNRQKEELKRRINLREFRNLEIGTVDSFQGRERDVVIFSCVRTEGVGFLGGPERLNVALTRAKHSLIVVGNFMSLQRDQTWNSLLNDARSRDLLKPVVNNNTAFSLVFKPKS